MNSSDTECSLIIPTALDVSQRMYRPDFLGGIFEVVKEQVKNRNDGATLVSLCEENGRDIGINEAFEEFKGFLREASGISDLTTV